LGLGVRALHDIKLPEIFERDRSQAIRATREREEEDEREGA
jgi:hypothetical protein